MTDDGDNDNRKQELRSGRPVVLDEHRGLTAQKEIDARRLRSHVRADQDELKRSQAALSDHLFSKPAETWSEVAEKCRYILRLFAMTGEAQNPRYKQLVADALEDLARLQTGESTPTR